MEYTIEDFRKDLERLRYLNGRGELNNYGSGKLSMAKTVENLILCEVGCSKPNEDEIPLIVYKGKKYMHVSHIQDLIDKGLYIEV